MAGKGKAKAGKAEEPRAFVPMDEEFEAEWMAERGMVKGEDWAAPFGRVAACELRLVGGVVVGPCWQKSGSYGRMDGEDDVPSGKVEAVRHYVEAGDEEKLEGPEGEDEI